MSSSVVLMAVGGSESVLSRAREVIRIEARTLDHLATSLDRNFVSACELLSLASGRIVVAGIGKSGHVGRKIAATLSATGSPAMYLHPGEAAHGDLGMVVEGDVILALSNSGNTAELQVLYDHAERRGIPVVGVTSGAGSLVDRRSTVCILMPQATEACSSNIAPTSSTAQQLALGDAIAMVLMDARGFSRDGFKELHPGGSIGLRLASVGQLMHGDGKLPLVELDLPMEEVISRMTSMGFGIAGVVDAAGRLVGIITDGDLRRHFRTLDQVRAQDVMTRRPRVLRAGMAAEDALRFLNASKITCAFVVAEDEACCVPVQDASVATGIQIPIGIIHVHDFLRTGLT
ncbi:KpsF/GutQ family sugar-phosphate isomerase [Novosphingobium sp. PhB165]|uniref:KpsF/GutQ family sugar-phosphate isomerase n=1 Tax=Novosphingobium sp. PhB165 TaxID=2485105 RepID=UPI001FB2622F|nr:KpsF/GutQ family sugar-phosphate isomerase [Novosphingobium sp. PhB165]